LNVRRIDSDTADQRLIQNRLVLVGLPPLRSDASDAEVRADLDAIMADLEGRDVMRPRVMRWIARVAPAAGGGVSTSAVIQLDRHQRQMVAKLSVFRRRWTGRPEELLSWPTFEILRLNATWMRPEEHQNLCDRHFERFGNQSSGDAVKSRCRLGDGCPFSHRLEDLRRLQQRDRDGATTGTSSVSAAQTSVVTSHAVADAAASPPSDGPFEFNLAL